MSENVERLKETAMNSNSTSTWKGAMETLATIGEEGQAALADIADKTNSSSKRDYAYKMIREHQ
jgi:hypothetical protein